MHSMVVGVQPPSISMKVRRRNIKCNDRSPPLLPPRDHRVFVVTTATEWSCNYSTWNPLSLSIYLSICLSVYLSISLFFFLFFLAHGRDGPDYFDDMSLFSQLCRSNNVSTVCGQERVRDSVTFFLFLLFSRLYYYSSNRDSRSNQRQKIYIYVYCTYTLNYDRLDCCRVAWYHLEMLFFWYIYIHVDENLYGKLFMHSSVRRSILGIVIGVLYTCTFCRYVFLEWKHTKNHENPFSCRLYRLYRFFEKRK